MKQNCPLIIVHCSLNKVIPNRMDRIDSIMQNLIAEAIDKELEISLSVLVTVTGVRTSKDVSQCKVYLSVLPFNRSRETVDHIRRASKVISAYIFKKRQMKNYPRLEFYVDETPQEAMKMEARIKEVREGDKEFEEVEDLESDDK